MSDQLLVSDFNFGNENPSSHSGFTDIQHLSSVGYNHVVKAQRKGKWYILKGLTDEYSTTDIYVDALHKEYDILRTLQHPNIISTYGIEEVEGLGECIVMEYVSGRNLSEALQEGLSEEAKREILHEIMDGLEYIHKKQIAHRDLKPSNIMISDDGSHVKLIDFGLSDSNSFTFLNLHYSYLGGLKAQWCLQPNGNALGFRCVCN